MKIALIKEAKPEIAFIQESRNTLPQIAGWKSYHSVPRTCRDGGDKINAAMMVAEEM
jgi:hypothetical protein